jgi:hypothetical protein
MSGLPKQSTGDFRPTWSNYRAALDAATALCLQIERLWRGASERGRSAM